MTLPTLIFLFHVAVIALGAWAEWEHARREKRQRGFEVNYQNRREL